MCIKKIRLSTNIFIDDNFFKEAIKYDAVKSKKALVQIVFKILVKQHKLKHSKYLQGKVIWAGDLN